MVGVIGGYVKSSLLRLSITCVYFGFIGDFKVVVAIIKDMLRAPLDL